ncbi:MAG: MogA/MoaB family molybdenum cofactor biosynthesis protein [Candidatus Omnitrophica bacterium]|nr:MogA/MoaB family molybdenum cofactor biosynthesis protein [Candidatus Omnitrophota bacterium]
MNSDRDSEQGKKFKCAVLTLSDRCSRKEYEDESGKIIAEFIKGIGGEVVEYDVIPDEIDMVKEKLIHFCDHLRVDVVLTTGGTGLGPRDITPEATKEVSQKIIPGISELIRIEGLKKTRNSMLSRGISAVRGNSIIINLPGSPKGARESLQAILDIVPHALRMLKGEGHSDIHCDPLI